jgi:molybdenum cofactor cytidylyltransferase
VTVVPGANADKIRPYLNGLPIRVAVNDSWAEGIAAPIRAGMEELLSLAPNTMGVIIALADQPGFSAEHVAGLLGMRAQNGSSIIASQCGGKLMPPVFFAAAYFSELNALRGDLGARSLLGAHAEYVAIWAVEGMGDLDTPTDCAEYLKQHADSKSLLGN